MIERDPVSFTVPVDIYKRGVLFYFGKRKGLLSYIRQAHPDYYAEVRAGLDRGGDAMCISLSGDTIVYARDVPTVPVLVHEAVHAAEDVLGKVDVEASGEPMAYLVEYLVAKALERITSCVGVSP